MTESVEETSEGKLLLEKAIDLFTFLGNAQQLLAKPVRTTHQYEKVMWFGALPTHPAIDSAHRAAFPEPGNPHLTIQRIPKVDPPALPEKLQNWLDGEIDDPGHEPTLPEAILVDQPVASVSPRDLGPGTLEAVPPAELARHLSDVAGGDPTPYGDRNFRAVPDLLGLKRLPGNTRQLLTAAMTLVDGQGADS